MKRFTLARSAAIAALAGMMVSGDVSLAGTPPRGASKVPPPPEPAPDPVKVAEARERKVRAEAADQQRLAQAEAKRERKRLKRIRDLRGEDALEGHGDDTPPEAAA